MSLDDTVSDPIGLGDEPLNVTDEEDLLDDPLVEEVVSDEFSLLAPIETEDDKDDMGLDDLESYD